MSPRETPEQARLNALQDLHIESAVKAHELIVNGIKAGAPRLLQRGLNSIRLIQLGYTREGMMRLGCDEKFLAALGYPVPKTAAPVAAAAVVPDGAAGSTPAAEILRLMAGGMRAHDLRVKGIAPEAVKRAGVSAIDMAQIGFELAELARIFGPSDLRRANFGVREIRRFFGDSELKSAGFDAVEMRSAGYSIRDLMRIGYSENQIRGAGFSTNELSAEGLTRVMQS